MVKAGEPPEKLDGARVLAVAAIDGSVTPTGGAVHRIGEQVLGPFTGLAIAQYDGDGQFYLFYCNAEWRVLADTSHPSEELARDQAEFEYRGIVWRKRPT